LKPTRLISPPGSYFVTSTTWQRRRLFVVENIARLFLKTLYGYRRQGRYELHAFVLMPDHFHLLLTPANDITLERAMQLIKGGFSHAMGEERGRGKAVWERGFTDHRIRDVQDFEHHRDYVHANPVEDRLVERACDYRYCSAFPGFKLDLWPSAAKAGILGAA
jgi:putative transposase